MRRRRLPVCPISRRRAASRGEQGSIVLEAALVMPILLLVLVFFMILIRLCAVQMSLQSAASQAVRQIAANIYPADLALQKVGETVPLEQWKPVSGELADWGSIAAQAAEWLPDPAGSIASAVLRGDWKPVEDMASTALGRSIVEPLIRDYANEAILERDRLHLSRLSFPDLKNKQEPYLTIEVEYEFPFRLPFVGRPLLLREQASERVWVGDPLPAQGDGGEGEGEKVPVQIVSIAPMPLRPGQKATAVALTKPHASAVLTVRYKSGQSVAKNLGQATADENGYVSWTWHVGGNTTPGVWELTVESASGETASMHFIVEKKSG